MGKDGDKKEETGFGFKDKTKALETLQLLEKEPASYQGLTVRGLLGRAKRTLKLTKDGEKIKNITEAIEVFEKWTEDKKKSNGSDDKKKTTSKSEKKNDVDDEDKKGKEDNSSDSVPGLGFKDKEKALETIKLLDGRDPDYQKLAVKGLVGRAKRVLTCTKDKDKLQNINDAMEVFEKFLKDFEKKNMSKHNMSYLPLSVIENCLILAEHHNVVTPKTKQFLDVYKSVDGQYKKLRTVENSDANLTWDIIRNKELNSIRKKNDDPDLFEDEGNPTKEHLELILWAYSPQDSRMKKLKIIPPTDADEKMDSDESSSDDNKNEKSKERHSKDNKRKHSSSSEDDDETPSKKKK